ncbi:SusD/RagB family nutrient-binding outer membrane lipoprotein [Rhodohalobacter barkolensis]|uniref:SusD/RagB family nutrient-binding outer membrane lipoprotein n=1 Tax=Rhodohalobacter barkolensis TaxID=2053187 RepID=A0A2N0VH42_9BACT|nr:SusD/RagB family nutrient-binding outer membrane lipoprotein [Rhodohalobacter barkolensis]
MKKITLLFFTVILFVSCDLIELDDDINNNPNSPSEASAPQLLANAMRYTYDTSSNTSGQFLGQYMSETQYVVASLYPQEGTSFYGWYQNPLINVETVINTASADNQLAVAKILKAYFFWHVTDRWGDVPFSEALNGGDNITPAYDTQESIYNNLFELLEEGVNQIDESTSLSSDIMFGGDMAKWRKFGNSLKLLIALRLSEVDEIKAEDQFNDALSSPIIDSIDDNFAYQHLDDQSNENYWYNQVERQSREWWALTETLVNIMEPVDDPRLLVYGEPARTDGEYRGLPIGSDPVSENTEAFSLIGEDIRRQDATIHLVTYSQILFARAEAAARGWTTEDAEDLYNQAITQSIIQWTGSDDDATDFLSQPDIAFDVSTAIEQIATQRYVHLFLNGYEAWAEWRRTGFPNFVTSGGNDVPTRQAYTSEESFNNTENYEEAIQRQFGGENTLYGKVWWDVN